MNHFNFKLIVSFFTTLLVLGCSKEQVKENETSSKSPIYFNEVNPDSSGVLFSNDLYHKSDLNIIEYLYYYNGGGVAIGDINNDGLEDIYFTANQKPDKLYLNKGNLTFEDITENAGIKIDSTWSSGVTMADVNNDGYLDIYVSKVGNYKSLKSVNQLYLNNGDTTFTESAKEYGLDFSGFSTQASFFDYDQDGDLDMYLMNHSIHTPRSYGNIKKRKQKDSLSGDILYENQLEKKIKGFVDVTDSAGIYSSALGYGLALITSDIDNDGLVDIYVGNDFHENDYLYINQGDKTFKEESEKLLNSTSRFTMGVDTGDLNEDLKTDIFTLDMMPDDAEIFLKSGGEDTDKVSQIKENFGFQTQYARNHMQLGGDSNFSDVALLTNTHASDWSWSALIEDYDNDGINDIFVTTGIYKRPNDLDYINYLSSVNFASYDQTKLDEIEKELIDQMPTLSIANAIFKNNGRLQFTKLSENAGLKPSYSNGAAIADLDNDGDIDIAVNNINQTASILENRSHSSKRNFVSFSLKGNEEYFNVLGTKIKVYTGGGKFVKELTGSRGFQSSSTHKIHFGLGSYTKIDSIKIFWPDGKLQTEKNVPVNQENLITRTTNLKSSDQKSNKDLSYEIFPFTHLENNYLDYEQEALIPEKLSMEGPAVVHDDFNGDGVSDLFIGNSKNQIAQLYINDNGNYVRINKSQFAIDQFSEDVDAASFDFDNDGDLDIYVISGGNDKVEGDFSLQDKVYINDGTGNFKKLKSILPATNGGSISVGDFNNDGFDDLFIGSRSMPGGYGLSPYSFILKNTGKNSFEILKKERFGMITDSEWADVNGDSLIDLILVGDWMPVTILINNGDDTFINKTAELGLGDTNGMWNTIEIADIDSDGKVDIIAGNAGLNMKWKASKEKPVKLYIDDFDNNEQPDPIIFYDLNGTYVPFASKDKLASQMPFIKKKFTSYSDFSKVNTIEDLTGKKENEILETRYIKELRSMVFYNKSTKFDAMPLPVEAQMSSIEDIIVVPEEKGTLKLIYVGNNNRYVTELGNNNSNAGGVFYNYNNSNSFSAHHKLPIPANINSRKIVKIGNQRYLVIVNNDKSYTFELP
ncbi:VCBS repeat-containing protein [Spongiivirga sp. MCCC 1A20706]|uniref:VCBS repeat-containing protein n=1 Tax=Spongiivirga sp. MCCC 1A20706 TaxID=3160963 RepID=UPI003977C32B